MTYEEALKILDTIPTISEQVDALEMAIEALEKQIPKKPYCDEYEECCCSNCDEILHLEDWDKPYCPHCGQHLDWSDDECD